MSVRDYFEHQRQVYMRLAAGGKLTWKEHEAMLAEINEMERKYDSEVRRRQDAERRMSAVWESVEQAYVRMGGKVQGEMR